MDQKTVMYRKSLRWHFIRAIIFISFLITSIITKDPFSYFVLFITFMFECIGIPDYISHRIILEDLSIYLLKDLINTKRVRIPYSKINSIQVDALWANGGNILISTSDGDYLFTSMGNIQELQQKLNVKIEEALVNAKAPASVNLNDRESNNIAELERLASLRQNGAISEQEYNIMKQKIINNNN